MTDSMLLIHYNGWSNRWDEWIDIKSNRLSMFRTHTVQQPNSLLMSPNPEKMLDGD